MGKHRRRHKTTSRSERDRRTAELARQSHLRHLEKILRSEEGKANFSEYEKKIAALEKDLLSRTVYITNVRDLNEDSNLSKLRLFLEDRYGSVERCWPVACHHNKSKNFYKRKYYPPARVTFHRAVDAQKIFGGQSLLTLPNPVQIHSNEVGAKGGMIRVMPSYKDPNIITQNHELTSDSVITLKLEHFELGHWCPNEQDLYHIFCYNDQANEETVGLGDNSHLGDLNQEDKETWVQESIHTADELVIDLTRRSIEIRSQVASSSPSPPPPRENVVSSSSPLDFVISVILGDGIFSTEDHRIISFRFKDLHGYLELCVEERSEYPYSLLFLLKHPPHLYKETKSLCNPIADGVDGKTRNRVCDSNFGQCLAYRMFLSDASVDVLLHHKGLKKLKKFGVVRPELYSKHEGLAVRTLIGSRDDRNRGLDKLAQIHKMEPEIGFLLRTLIDDGKFSWFHVLHNRSRENGGPDLLQAVGGYIQNDQSLIVKKALCRMLDCHGSTRYPCQLFLALASESGLSDVKEEEEAIPSYCFKIPRLLVSPCREKLCGLEVEMSNRVVRRFTEREGFQKSSFLRVQIGDENGAKLFGNEITPELENRIKTILESGIVLNGILYEFLAYSSSQLKELSLWMVHPEHGWTVGKIRQALGNFEQCKTASKYAARIGQCFSTTVEGLLIETSALCQTPVRHQTIDDIISSGGLVHSDGTGLINKHVMTKVTENLPFAPANREDVSIIQVRFGGAKGTLVAWDFDELRSVHPHLVPQGADICVRPSMVKFDAPYDNVEVCAIGSRVPYYLNRNVILLLGVHGVEDQTFVDIQKEMIDKLDNMLSSSGEAAFLLPRLGGPDSSARSTLMNMLQCGLTPETDPFLYSCLVAIRSHHLFNLRKKANSFVEKGAVLMGGLDETGMLKEGCVFLQVSKPPEKGPTSSNTRTEFEIIEGPVLVTKHPAMHPGDVRMFLAVDNPALRGHRNVLLFSQHGSRPEANKMAGSDLDGDQFAVTWDERLFLKNWNGCFRNKDGKWLLRSGEVVASDDLDRLIGSLQRVNVTPLDYEAPNATAADLPPSLPSQGDTKALSDALIQHFIRYAQNDNLGQIAILWLDHAVKVEKDGAYMNRANCNACIELAGLHSVSVDFQKTGIPAAVPEHLRIPSAQPRAHWREKKGAPTYHCQSILGKLYDEVVQRMDQDPGRGKVVKALVGRKTDKYGQILSTAENCKLKEQLQEVYDFSLVSRLGFDFNSKRAEDLHLYASENRVSYEEDVLALLNRFNLRSEGELCTGCIRKFHKLQKKKSPQEVAEQVRRQCYEIRSNHRMQFFRTVLDLVDRDYESSISGTIDSEDVAGGSQEEKTEEDIVTEIAWAEQVSTRMFVSQEQDDTTTSKAMLVRRMAFSLAAAYYMTVYSPQLRQTEESRSQSSCAIALFGFPWLVSDVILAKVHYEDES